MGPTPCVIFDKTSRNVPSLQDGLIGVKEELRSKTTSASFDAVGNSTKDKNRVFVQYKEFIKFSLINDPTDVIKSLLN